MKKLLLSLLIAFSIIKVGAQNVVQANIVNAKQTLILNSFSLNGVLDDSSLAGNSHTTVPTTYAIYNYIHNHMSGGGSVDWSSITGKPNNIVGYGITDAYPLSGNPSNFLTSITSSNVTTALGFTPYNATNPSGYITSSALSSYVPTTTTITINGITYDLSTNRSWTISGGGGGTNYFTKSGNIVSLVTPGDSLVANGFANIGGFVHNGLSNGLNYNFVVFNDDTVNISANSIAALGATHIATLNAGDSVFTLGGNYILGKGQTADYFGQIKSRLGWLDYSGVFHGVYVRDSTETDVYGDTHLKNDLYFDAQTSFISGTSFINAVVPGTAIKNVLNVTSLINQSSFFIGDDAANGTVEMGNYSSTGVELFKTHGGSTPYISFNNSGFSIFPNGTTYFQNGNNGLGISSSQENFTNHYGTQIFSWSEGASTPSVNLQANGTILFNTPGSAGNKNDLINQSGFAFTSGDFGFAFVPSSTTAYMGSFLSKTKGVSFPQLGQTAQTNLGDLFLTTSGHATAGFGAGGYGTWFNTVDYVDSASSRRMYLLQYAYSRLNGLYDLRNIFARYSIESYNQVGSVMTSSVDNINISDTLTISPLEGSTFYGNLSQATTYIYFNRGGNTTLLQGNKIKFVLTNTYAPASVPTATQVNFPTTWRWDGRKPTAVAPGREIMLEVTTNDTAAAAIVYAHWIDDSSQTIMGGIINKTIFTPTTGSTITALNRYLNLISPTGALATLTINLPLSPLDGDEVKFKFTQSIASLSFSGATVKGALTTASQGQEITLTWDAGTSSYY